MISDMFVIYIVLIIVSLLAKKKLRENKVNGSFINICFLLLFTMFSLLTYKNKQMF